MTAVIPAAATSEQLGQQGTDRPPRDPGKWEYSHAENVVKAQNPDWVDTARLFVVDGDHWQDGAAWIGPQLDQGEDGALETLQLLQKGFVSRNALAEITDRYTNGIVGFEPAWALVPKRARKADDKPTPEEQTLIDEAHAALTDWWDRNGIAVRFWNAVYQMTWASRSPLRLYLSARAFETRQASASSNGNGNGTRRVVPKKKDIAEALQHILLDVPTVGASAVYVDPDTQEEVGVYLFKRSDGVPRAELTYRLPTGETVVRVINGEAAGDNVEVTSPGDGDEPETEPVLDSQREVQTQLAGLLTMHQLDRARLLTDQAFQIQRALNLTHSVLPRGIVTAGFLERILINAKLPGKWVDDSNGGKRWQPNDVPFGAGVTLDLQGAIDDDGKGTKKLMTPDVKWKEPTAMTGTIEAQRAVYAALLEECKQGHIVLTAEATPSGRSRAEARADYINSLRTGKNPVDRAGRWLIMATLALAEHLTNQPGKYTSKLRARFVSRLNPGPLSNEERAQNVAEWKEGLRSRESVMIAADIEDPDAEIMQIGSEPAAQLTLSIRQAEAMQAWIDVGASVELAAELIGLDPELAKKLGKDLFPTDLNGKPNDGADDETGGDDGGSEDGGGSGE